MKVFAGIDLGSTTTKCVLLDENGGRIGQGITNTRANFDVACDVAKSNAELDARVRLFGRLLTESASEPEKPRVETLARSLERAIWLAQYRATLAELETEMLGFVLEGRRLHGDSHALGGAVREILTELRSRAAGGSQTGKGHPEESFRERAGSQFLELAEARARPGYAEFETLMALYDRSILKVENRPSPFSFESGARQALPHALAELDVMTRVEWLARTSRALDSTLAANVEVAATVGTGYGRQRLPFRKEWIRSEILCHGLGAHAMFPGTRTVIDIGGQDTKAIRVDASGIVEKFQMNDRCAAGCGRFLGYIADELNLGLSEIGPLALTASRVVPVNSTCTVFAGAELRDRLSSGEKREEVLAGLHRAIVTRALSLVARVGGAVEEVTFTGGVARNPAVVRYVRQLLEETYGIRTLNISPESIYTGALGAALFAHRGVKGGAAA